MRKLTLVLAAMAFAGAFGEARAAQGFYDAYGYHAPARGGSGTPNAGMFNAKPPKAKQAGFGEPAFKKKKSQDAPALSVSASAPAKVNVSTGYGAGKIVIDQSAKKLYYTVSSKQAYVYPVAVGKEGFKWTGTKKISKEVDWPDWRPPAEMRQRKPNLPEYMAGGPRNPLGAKALYLGNSLYRIHGTNDPKSIGTDASSGCIRMHNGHVVHLSKLAGVGTTVHVVSKLPRSVASN